MKIKTVDPLVRVSLLWSGQLPQIPQLKDKNIWGMTPLFNPRFILCFGIIIFMCISFTYGISVESADYTVKRADLLGSTLNLVSGKVTFDSDLYLLDAQICPNYTCPTNLQCACDFTDANPLGCGIASPECAWIQPQCDKEKAESCTRFKDIPINVKQTYTIETKLPVSTPLYLKFFAPPNECMGYRIVLEQIEGKVYLTEDYHNYTRIDTPSRVVFSKESRITLTLCPTDLVSFNNTYELHYPFGTIFFMVINNGLVDAKFNLLVESFPLHPLLSITPPPCETQAQNIPCAIDGQVMYNEATIDPEYVYSFTVYECKFVSVSLIGVNQDADLYIGEGFVPTVDNYSHSSSYSIDEYLTLKICPDEGQTNKTLYFLFIQPDGVIMFLDAVVTTTAILKPIELSSLPSLAGTWALGSTSYLINSYDQVILCDNYDVGCMDFFPSSPREFNNPLYPVPGIFLEQGTVNSLLTDISINEDSNPTIKRSYQFGLVLSVNFMGYNLTLHRPDELDNLRIVFLGRIVDKDGNALPSVPIQLKASQYGCNYDQFSTVGAEQKHILRNIDTVRELVDVANLRYQFDLLLFRDPYYYCRQSSVDMIQFSYETHVDANSTTCPSYDDFNSYLTDPCCTLFATFTSVCLPHAQNMTTRVFDSVKTDQVSEQCSFDQCAQSVLTNYAQSLVAQDNAPCIFDNVKKENNSDVLYHSFRTCQSTLYPPFCSNDTECLHFDAGAYCNLKSRTCMIPQFAAEKLFISCIINSVPVSLLTEVTSDYEVDVNNPNGLVEFLHTKNTLQKDDCVTDYNVELWSRFAFQYNSDSYTSAICFDVPIGLDRSKGLDRYDACLQGYMVYQWVGWYFTEPECAYKQRCDWLGYNGGDNGQNGIATISQQCASPSRPAQFCGDCTDPRKNCYSNNTITDPAQCNNTFVCYRQAPQLSYQLWVDDPKYTKQVQSESECDALGTCNMNCGYKCSNTFSCVIPLNESSHSCPYIVNATVIRQGRVGDAVYCILGGDITLSQCQQLAGSGTYQYTPCGSLNPTQCTVCNGPNKGCGCQLEEIECTSKTQCESQVGECSDSFYFNRQLGGYPTQKPKCIFPPTQSRIISNSLPQCDGFLNQESPIGCYSDDILFLNQTHCEIHGGIYWTQATDFNQCNATWGCLGYDRSQTFILPSSKRFNAKNQEDCALAGEEWAPMFSWKPAVWIPAVSKRLHMIPTQGMQHLASYKSSFSFESFFSEFEKANLRLQTILYKSELLCRVSTSLSVLDALTCSCNGGSGDCYANMENTASTIVQPCSDQMASAILTTGGTVVFPTSGVSNVSCVLVSIGDLFADQFLAKRVVALSSSFITYVKPGDYSVFNKNGAVIGQVISDGVSLNVFDQGIKYFQVCLPITLDYDSSKYPHMDIARLSGHGGVVEALECNLVKPYVNSSLICCDQVHDIQVGVNEYIIVARISDWKSLPYHPFTNSGTGMIYTLAIFFLILSLIGLSNLLYFAYSFFLLKQPYKVVYLLFFFLFFFSFIRTIYFFLLPTGKLSLGPNVGEYILVVLPTFLYFTSFTIVITIWYILSNTNITMYQNVFKVINKLILASNTVLYLLFIIIILVFNFTKEKDPPTCGGRMFNSYSDSAPQNVVSILYAVIQAILSLIIGVAFIYFGSRIYKQFATIRNESKSSNIASQKRKTVVMGLICSIGFVLHCIFIIVLVSAKPSNIDFSFAGLLITEIIPVFTLFVTYNQIPIPFAKYLPSLIRPDSGNTNSHSDSKPHTNIKMSTTSSTNMSSTSSQGLNASQAPVVYLNQSNRNHR